MDPRFQDIYNQPENQVFHVVFFPDRIYHAQYLNATRSVRYRYNVREVRSISGITALKGEVYLDGRFYTNFIRLEYRAARLVELSRESGRLKGDKVMAWLKMTSKNSQSAEAQNIWLHYCPWIDAYQVEIWRTLEPVTGASHDIQVLDIMGRNNSITRIPAFNDLLSNTKNIGTMEVAFREFFRDYPAGRLINNPKWDNFFERNIQVPNTQIPGSSQNTVKVSNYLLNFQRGWFIDTQSVEPVRYRNAMMNDNDSERFENNVIEMKWILQRELGSELVFFHEVTIPPNTVEGTHRHIGSEEVYYILDGDGIAYMGENDDPSLAVFPTVERQIFGLHPEKCKELPVRKGHVIYTKSGGIHGIKNTSNTTPLRFVAFLYHSA